MVFYYTGTGNSLWATEQAAAATQDVVKFIPDERKKEGKLHYSLAKDERLGIVFPIHAWNPPQTVLEWIDELVLENYKGQYVYVIMTCAGSAANARKVITKALEKKGIHVSACFELLMPNNYIVGSRVDTKEELGKIFAKVEKEMEQAQVAIKERKQVTTHIRSLFPVVKTTVIGYFFWKYGKSTNPFSVTDDCVACELCKNICPKGTISIQQGKPVWGTDCDQCLGCINRCPKKAIRYGKNSAKRGTYQHPCLKNTNG